MSSKISFDVGNGQMVKFWKDERCGIDPLWDSFPSLFSLTCSKDAWVEDVLDFSIPEEEGWSPSFSRPLNDWEVGCGGFSFLLGWDDGEQGRGR